MRAQNRKVLLIMDNAPSHGHPELSHVKIHFLPPTTTSHLQPLDAGIIQCFKGHYRRSHLRHIVDLMDNNKPPAVLVNEAIRFIKKAWDSVSVETIRNCWYHSGLISRDVTQVAPQDVDRTIQADSEFNDLLTRVYSELDTDPDMRLTVRELVNMDQNVENSETVSEDTIIESITGKPSDDDEDSCDQSEILLPPPPPTASQARNALETVIRFFESQSTTMESDMTKLFTVQQNIKNCEVASKQQTKLMDYFKRV